MRTLQVATVFVSAILASSRRGSPDHDWLPIIIVLASSGEMCGLGSLNPGILALMSTQYDSTGPLTAKQAAVRNFDPWPGNFADEFNDRGHGIRAEMESNRVTLFFPGASCTKRG
jgi:hypothetical protein